MIECTRLLNIPEFARAAGLTNGLARRLVKRGDIPSVPVGSRRRVEERWVKRWLLNGQEVQPTAIQARRDAYEPYDG